MSPPPSRRGYFNGGNRMSRYSEDTLEDTYHPANMISAACRSLNPEQVKDLLSHGVELTERARRMTEFAKVSNTLGKAGEKLDDATEELNRALKKGKSWATDVSAACQIAEAIDVLNAWVLPGSKVGSREAA